MAAFGANSAIVVSGPGERHSAININILITCDSDTLVDFSLYDYLSIAAFFSYGLDKAAIREICPLEE
tara:strand:+ start:1085 stop:1288 length:204 start_codon:yes stop_codon:yes gene_type:complete